MILTVISKFRKFRFLTKILFVQQKFWLLTKNSILSKKSIAEQNF